VNLWSLPWLRFCSQRNSLASSRLCALAAQVCLPTLFGGSADLTFGINWAGNNGGSLSWDAGDGDDTSTCLYGLWNNVRCSRQPCSCLHSYITRIHYHACRKATRGAKNTPIRSYSMAATPLMCAMRELQGQPYSCQGSQSSSGCKYHVPKGCGAKAQYPTYILGKVRVGQNAC